MAYVALYRKWRPGSFSTLVGQEHISRTLTNAIEQEKLAHAYLFTGPRGTGKTSTAKILAKALNCEKGPTAEPCNECENCRRINDGTSMDVYEIDAASNRGISEIRELQETVKFAPVDGRFKVYIIDEVHMLTAEAFNALLKTLEEPPANVVFVLATTEVHKVPQTIQSRCQRYDFKRIAVSAIESRLREVCDKSAIAADDAALSLIACQADGGMRDALSILDQCAALADNGVTAEVVRDVLGLVGHEWVLRITRAIAARDTAEILKTVAELLNRGRDLRQLLVELMSELRAVMVYQAAGKIEGVSLYEADEALLAEQAKLFAAEQFMPMLRRLHEALNELKTSNEPRITVETALLSLCFSGKSTAAALPPMREMPSVTGPAVAAAADNARLKALEAQVTQLSALVKTLSERPAAPAPAAPRTAAKRQSARIPLKPAAKPMAQLAVTAEGEAVFAKLRDAVNASGRPPLAACMAGTTFAGMDEACFRLQAPNSFTMNRLSQKDYKQFIEGCLKEICGQELRFECVFEQAPKEPPPPPPEPERDPADIDMPDFSELSAEGRAVMERTMKVLGTHFVDKEIYDREHKL